MKSRKAVHNVVLFAVVVLSAGWLGRIVDELTGAGDDAGIGQLIWILAPIATATVLRLWGGDGWGDAGSKPRFRGGGNVGWYAVSLPAGGRRCRPLGESRCGRVPLGSVAHPLRGGVLGLHRRALLFSPGADGALVIAASAIGAVAVVLRRRRSLPPGGAPAHPRGASATSGTK